MSETIQTGSFLTVVGSLLLSFFITGIGTAILFPWLRSLRIRRDVRIDTPETHQTKQGTPSMGGIGMLVGLVATTLTLNRTTHGLLLVAAALFFGGIGFWDDWAKATGAENRGIKARHKLVLQLVGCGVFIAVIARMRGFSDAVWASPATVDLGAGYVLWAALVIIATCNAANITDGLDGLAAGLAVIVAASLGAVAILVRQPAIAVFCAMLAGAAAGFLIFNTRKASIFMGDTGSLAIGAALATSSLMLRCELLLPLIALPFVIDALSVVLQVVTFKTTGKRIFRMAPIHHGFELQGWSEWRIVMTFWTIGAVAALSTVCYFSTLLETRPFALLH